jgi:hypothetical protein
MANWEKLNKEFDEALDSMTKEDWKSWYERFKQKQINQNNMTQFNKGVLIGTIITSLVYSVILFLIIQNLIN